MTNKSDAVIAGVVVSPTTNACLPNCVRRIANDFSARPDRPAPARKMRSD